MADCEAAATHRAGGSRGERRVVVVGGGITGLSAAYRLRRLCATAGLPVRIRLLEGGARLGGQIRTEDLDGVIVEAGPDSLVAQKPAGLALCRELGLADEVVRLDEARPSLQVVHRGRLAALPDGFAMIGPMRAGPLLASPLFSWRGKARMLCEPLIPARPAALRDESLSSFVVRRFGREALERAAEPIFGGLFTADADRLSAAMSVPRLRELERRHGSVLRGLRRGRRESGGAPRGGFLWLRNGLERLVERLREELGDQRISLGARVDALRFEPGRGRWLLRPADGAAVEADAVILACPAFAAARLLQREDAWLAGELARLRYASCATLYLLYRQEQVGTALRGHGFFVPRRAGLPLLACSYVGAKFGGRVPSDRVLLRAFVGGALEPGVLELDDAALTRRTHGALAALLRIEGGPLRSRVHRHPHAMPQYPVGDANRVDGVRQRLQSLPGLFLAGGALGAIGLPDCIESGSRAAREAARLLSAGPRRLELVVGA